MENALDFILRSPYANEFATIIANKDGSAAEILNPDIEKKGVFPTDEIISTIEQTTKKHGTIKKINAVEFFSEYIEEGIDPLIPIIKYEKSKKSDDKSSSILTGMASFKKNVINEELDKEELVAYNTINNNYYDIVDVIDYKKTSLSVILFNPKSKLEVKLKNNNIEVNIKTTLEARIGESHTNTEIENKKVINEITKETEKNIQRKINKLLDYCKKYNVDLLGIKNQIYKKYNNQYKNYKNNHTENYYWNRRKSVQGMHFAQRRIFRKRPWFRLWSRGLCCGIQIKAYQQKCVWGLYFAWSSRPPQHKGYKLGKGSFQRL